MRTNAFSPQPPRALVIGAGPAAAALHLPVLAQLRDRGMIVLVEVCDIDHERAAAAGDRFGFRAFGGDAVAALERSDIEVVYIFGSAQLHHAYGMQALRLGKHLFVEKPVAPDYTQARDLAELAAAQGLIAAGGLNRRFLKSLAQVRAHAGQARWRYAEAVFHRAEFGAAPLFGARTWLSANGIHALDALLFMMGGPPEHLMAQAGEHARGNKGAFSALMRWPDGAQGVFLCNNNSGSRREEYVFHGPDESCRIGETGLTIERKGRPSTVVALPLLGDGFAEEHDAFLQAVRLGRDPPHGLAAVAPSMFVAELIERGFNGRVELPKAQSRGVMPKRTFAGMSILVVEPAGLHTALADLLPQYRLVSLQDVRRSAAARPDIVAAILGRGAAALPGDILERLPQLRVVGVVALSVARVAPEALLARGIELVNASGAYAESVAEFALGLAILGRRRAFFSHEAMSAGRWGTVPPEPGLKGMVHRAARRLGPVITAAGLEEASMRLWRAAAPIIGGSGADPGRSRDLRGATVGLVGWGANARAFAGRLGRVPAHVLVYSEHATQADIRGSGAVPAALGEVLAADVVSLHRGLTLQTRHCLGAPELAKLRPGTVLINIARGALIDPGALLTRLRMGDIFACLDTFEEEPLPAAHPLRHLPNVFLTAHIAGGSPDNHAAAAFEVVDKVRDYLAGGAPEAISTDRLQTMS
jgi:phosphoglycerate dehydrogenase-like enzyme/predicted dehydrogenase